MDPSNPAECIGLDQLIPTLCYYYLLNDGDDEDKLLLSMMMIHFPVPIGQPLPQKIETFALM